MRWEPDWKVEENRQKKLDELRARVNKIHNWRYVVLSLPFINGLTGLITAFAFNPPLPLWLRLVIMAPGLAIFTVWIVKRHIETRQISEELDRLNKE